MTTLYSAGVALLACNVSESFAQKLLGDGESAEEWRFINQKNNNGAYAKHWRLEEVRHPHGRLGGAGRV